jgi:conjugal transfer/entry exclusion protein
MKALQDFYCLKDGYALPTHYLGAEVKQWHFSQDVTKTKWALSSAQYIREAVKNIEAHLKTQNKKLYTANQPMHTE